MEPDLVEHARRVLGPCRAVRTLSRPGSTVLEVLDTVGTRWFVKHAVTETTWQRELHAYRDWAPALGQYMAHAHHVDPDARVLVLSAVEGRHPRRRDEEAHGQAGAVLRLLHTAVEARHDPGHVERWADRTDRWLLTAQDLVDNAQLHFLRSEVSRAHDLPAPVLVPCHGDYRPANWLVGAEGRLRLIDFGEARYDCWSADLTRLALGVWWNHPHLADVFLARYGRVPDEHERARLRIGAAVHAMVLVARGRRLGQPVVEARGRSRLAALVEGHPLLDLPRRRRSRWPRPRRRSPALPGPAAAGGSA